MENGLFSSDGRITRGTYWTRWVLALFINFAVGLIAGVERMPGIATFVTLPVYLFILIQGIKRLHDVDKSGWYLLVPFYNFVLLLTEGTAGPNQYGVDPTGRC